MWEGLLGGIEEVPGEDGAVNGSGRLPAAPWRRCSLGTRRAGEGPLAKKKGGGGRERRGQVEGRPGRASPLGGDGPAGRGDPAEGAPAEWGKLRPVGSGPGG